MVIQGYLFQIKKLGEELQLGRQLLESDYYNVYNRMINLIVRELVSDGTITKQQEASAVDPEKKYQTTQNLDRVCQESRDRGLSFSLTDEPS